MMSDRKKVGVIPVQSGQRALRKVMISFENMHHAHEVVMLSV